jgi:hypothetical protein
MRVRFAWLHTGVLGAGLAVLGAGSAIAVAADARSTTVAVAALLGAATGFGAARGGRTRSRARDGSAGSPSVVATLCLLGAAAAAWLVLGTALAASLDEAGLPKRSELFAFTDGLVAAAGILLTPARRP